MEFSSSKMNLGPKSNEEEDYMSDPKALNEYKEKISTLPRREGWMADQVYHYQGFWHNSSFLEGVMLAQEHFQPQPNDIILSSFPKSGTTWLKALSFAIVTRSSFDVSTNPLLTTTPHKCVLSLESDLAHNSFHRNLDTPLIGTHVPYTSLPKSIIDSTCKIIFICRNPKDTFVSLWHFLGKVSMGVETELADFEKAFDLFCEGVSYVGPYWDTVLSYWKASLESPEKILFLKYEDLKNETVFYVKKIAEFMGYPFSLEEEDNGMVQKIVDLCSFESLSKLEANKSGKLHVRDSIVPKNAYFRKGEIGDWKNHLTPMMATRLDKITKQKLGSYGFTFNVPSNA
jgi:hypothetical protein